MPGPGARRPPTPGSRRLLALAGAAVLLTAADTYVVVVALPAIMTGVGLGIEHLQRATPIVSGFLLGYVAMLPLLGRLSDLVGRRRVLLSCLLAFGAGSVLTATAHTLAVVVAGRGLQGLGGGGVVPVALALVADHWPPERRSVPLGVVGALQELGAVIGPLYGAAIVAVGTWRLIFWINLPVAAIVGLVAAVAGDPARPAGLRSVRRADRVGAALAAGGVVLATLGVWAPPALAGSLRWGGYFVPQVGGAAWVGLTTPVALAGGALLAVFAIWELAAPSGADRMIPLRTLRTVAASADLPGAALLAGVLACVVVIFSTGDPTREVVASSTPVLAPAGAVLLGAFAWRQRRAAHPLFAPDLLRRRPSWGALLVNLALGTGLMAALVDVPLFARATESGGSQVDAALVLMRFLAAVPAGAVAGGVLAPGRRGPVVAGGGAAMATCGFAAMSRWGGDALHTPLRLGGHSVGMTGSDVALISCGLGFGLAIAPLNAAMLAAVRPRLHGLASALLVVARTVGMLAGLSALTAVGVRRFYEAQARIGSPLTLCPSTPLHCAPYDQRSTAALLSELHVIFAGAAVATGAAALLSLVLLPERRTPGLNAGGVRTTRSSGHTPGTG